MVGGAGAVGESEVLIGGGSCGVVVNVAVSSLSSVETLASLYALGSVRAKGGIESARAVTSSLERGASLAGAVFCGDLLLVGVFFEVGFAVLGCLENGKSVAHNHRKNY
jgi:hypothetical protein